MLKDLADLADKMPILPYPTRLSVMEAALAAIERSSNAEIPAGYEDDEPAYLAEDDVAQSHIFRALLDAALRQAEPAPWLLRDLREFEQQIVADVIAGLEDTPDGRWFLSKMRSAAAQRCSDEQQDLGDDN